MSRQAQRIFRSASGIHPRGKMRGGFANAILEEGEFGARSHRAAAHGKQLGPSRLHYVGFAVATVLIYTIICRSLAASSEGLRLQHGFGEDLWLPYSSASALERRREQQQQQQQQERGGAAEGVSSWEEAGESSSGGAAAAAAAAAEPSSPSDPPWDYDSWGLPSLEQFEKTLSPELRRQKAAIASFAARFVQQPRVPSRRELACASSVAKAISKGTSNKLIGMVLPLQHVAPISSMAKQQHVPRLVRICKVLGEGFSTLAVEVEDLEAGGVLVMRIRKYHKDAVRKFENSEVLFLEVKSEMVAEEDAVRQACGNVPADLVAAKKGFAVPLFTAEIASSPEFSVSEDHYVFGHVELMEKMCGSLADLQKQDSGALQQSRDYVAQRLLQLVLKVQQCGLSHNDLKWANVLLQPDGAFCLSDFGSSVAFGRAFGSLTATTPQYQEPQQALRPSAPYEDPYTMAHANSDLWSLGVLLFELFTGSGAPYGQGAPKSPRARARDLAERLLKQKVRSDVLWPKLAAAKVPHRWAQLIARLLEPNKAHRITAWQILEEFPDLTHHVPE
ncbi:hypothetical protein, conserved [Eimeria tenella]|uniref:Protein kinase domain-containing protein n=1 Tax=Eimeria tenella TaxID=5802 RepID=U6L187_EIMTE|nr:hypothetical protein, conserved [Eimeria tenella]CDJ42369.1 hypothetical protein, conserved [Eimeria tenella]|eukprot:XP_013233119.1 hypothetical protein, conserved [Eimeria tenella]